ncbi:MAG: glutamate racemase [Paludibacter sp.]|nr:glutamate racemase [Paludibacter sp.]MDD4198915.1 glutamate racemase [Paludibacter sp.]MDD4428464.1 glutamate racemase [Paludibacter sp.]
MDINNSYITSGPVGIFDSGYGGLTILENIRKLLPEYDYIYLGDNARTPYGTRSFDVVYQYTLECVNKLFEMGCHLVILACNTASAKALRSIQQLDLPQIDPGRRVLGVIRPTVEVLDQVTKTKHVGIFATPGTVQSGSYPIEANKIFPDIRITAEACPMWVPLIENNEHLSEGAAYFVQQNIKSLLEKDTEIDSIILGCTHYPLMIPTIRRFLPPHIGIVSQGEIVARSLKLYMQRHPEMDAKCMKNGQTSYFTTESTEKFINSASIFMNKQITATRISF